ncbi:MAG: ABC transporter permease, partial [Deltaproteobacteria bacterium HGW-Deltaproteobacteria-7]
MELWVGALNLGFLYAFVAIGIYITFRIHDFPDITVDGTFTTGAAVTSVLVVAGIHPLLAVAASFLACTAAGSITALINTRLNVNSLLAGILVMTGLYSINLHIMGRSNIPLLDTSEFFTLLDRVNPGLPHEIWTALCLTIIMAASWMAISFFFKTDFGLSMRASGNNPVMASAAGINVDRVKIFGVAIANGLVGISGGLVAQYQGFADIGMGIGTVVTGLASVIIGESILKKHSVYVWIASAVIGSVIFRFMIAIALYAGMDPVDLKLLTAIFVLITL